MGRVTSALRHRRDSVSQILGDRALVYFGLRGTEAKSLMPIEQLSAVASIIAPPRGGIDAVTYESISRRRVDADRFHIDFDSAEMRSAFRRRLAMLVRRDSLFVVYSPNLFLEDFALASSGVEIAGIPRRMQAMFDHKPWAEGELQRLGVRTMKQRYYAAGALRHGHHQLAYPVVLRPSVGSGGDGLVVARDADDAARFAWAVDPESMVSISPYLESALPINVGGVVWANGQVTVHPISVQLIGIAGCTDKPFGFCGNDFGATSLLATAVIEEVEQHCRTIGHWMYSLGYRGAFGVDYLVDDDTVHFLEINPRLQGSSELSSDLVERSDKPGIILEHAAAVLGVLPTEEPSLLSWVETLDQASHLVVHRTEAVNLQDAKWIDASESPTVDLLSDPPIDVDLGAVIGRLRFESSITNTGRHLLPDVRRHLQNWLVTVDNNDLFLV